jgi:pilus assembly protein Flp/PilA
MNRLYLTLVTRDISHITSARSEKGATAVEYALMVALIALVIIAAVLLLGGRLRNLFNTTSTSI